MEYLFHALEEVGFFVLEMGEFADDFVSEVVSLGGGDIRVGFVLEIWDVEGFTAIGDFSFGGIEERSANFSLW